jgi:hypothetical protein
MDIIEMVASSRHEQPSDSREPRVGIAMTDIRRGLKQLECARQFLLEKLLRRRTVRSPPLSGLA